MSSSLPSNNPTAYLGVRPTNPGNICFKSRDPIALQDVNNYIRGDTWINTTTNQMWMLAKIVNTPGGGKQAFWELITGGGVGGVLTLTGDVGGAIAPDMTGTINVVGELAQGIQTAGVGSTITVSGVDATTASKGVAQFDPADFSTAAGVVSLSGTAAANWTASPLVKILAPNTALYAPNLMTLFIMPAVFPSGGMVRILGALTGSQWTITLGAGQTINFFNGVATSAGGTVVGHNFDGVDLLCTTANTTWVAINIKGNLTLT